MPTGMKLWRWNFFWEPVGRRCRQQWHDVRWIFLETCKKAMPTAMPATVSRLCSNHSSPACKQPFSFTILSRPTFKQNKTCKRNKKRQSCFGKILAGTLQGLQCRLGVNTKRQKYYSKFFQRRREAPAKKRKKEITFHAKHERQSSTGKQKPRCRHLPTKSVSSCKTKERGHRCEPAEHLWQRRRLRREPGFSPPTLRPRVGSPCRISRACSLPSELPFSFLNFLHFYQNIRRFQIFLYGKQWKIAITCFCLINSPTTDAAQQIQESAYNL